MLTLRDTCRIKNGSKQPNFDVNWKSDLGHSRGECLTLWLPLLGERGTPFMGSDRDVLGICLIFSPREWILAWWDEEMRKGRGKTRQMGQQPFPLSFQPTHQSGLVMWCECWCGLSRVWRSRGGRALDPSGSRRKTWWAPESLPQSSALDWEWESSRKKLFGKNEDVRVYYMCPTCFLVGWKQIKAKIILCVANMQRSVTP